MRRRLFNILAAVSLVSFALLIIISAFSLARPDWSVQWTGSDRSRTAKVGPWRIEYSTETTWPAEAPPRGTLFVGNAMGILTADWLVLRTYQEHERYYMHVAQTEKCVPGEIAQVSRQIHVVHLRPAIALSTLLPVWWLST